MIDKKPSRVVAAIGAFEPDLSIPYVGKRLSLEDESLSAAFHDRIDQSSPRFPPGDDHEGRVSSFV